MPSSSTKKHTRQAVFSSRFCKGYISVIDGVCAHQQPHPQNVDLINIVLHQGKMTKMNE